MRFVSCIALFGTEALLLVSPGTAGKGGPTPDPLVGWDGVMSPGGAVRYVTLTGTPGSTTVAAIRTRDGRVTNWRGVTGTFGVPQVSWDGTRDGLSANGRRLVLSSVSSRAYALRTTFLVLDTRSLRLLRRIELPGHWAFDALSPNGSTIYALQYGAAGSGHYSVRAIDAVRGSVVAGTIVDEREPDEEMLGSPMARAWSPTRAWAFTLYAKPNGTAFVHGLDTSRRSAVCLDLPWRGATEEAMARVRLHVSADGGTLTLSQPGLGRLGSIDLRSFSVGSVKSPG
jgi:hypothetical protein